MAAWGNALGGWRLQPRIRGRFAKKGLSSARLHKKARKRQGGFVPYRRHGIGHHTVGVNAGFGMGRKLNRRVSFGVYVRTDTKSGQKKAAQIAKAQERAQLSLSKAMPAIPGVAETPGGKLRHVKKLQSRAMRKITGGERRKGGGSLGTAYSRVGTDRNSLPTYVVRYNSPKDKAKGSKNKRNKSIVNYNVHSATGKRTYDWTQKPYNARPQRRKKARQQAGVLV